MTEDVWEPLRYFVGSWRGTEDGRSGVGGGERAYTFVLRETFLQMQNRSVFEPQEKNPTGEVHEDLGYFSYDRARKLFVYRGFYVEGFVNQYTVEIEAGGRVVRLVTEQIENGMPGLRARLTQHIRSADTFEEVFELAGPGKEFTAYQRNQWTRAIVS